MHVSLCRVRGETVLNPYVDLLTLEKTLARIGLNQRQLERLLRRKQFPPPTIVQSLPYFWVDEVQRWIESLPEAA